MWDIPVWVPCRPHPFSLHGTSLTPLHIFCTRTRFLVLECSQCFEVHAAPGQPHCPPCGQAASLGQELHLEACGEPRGVCVCWCVFQQGGVADCDECTRLPSLVRPCTRQRRLQPGNLSALHSFLMIACLFPAGTCKIVMLFHALSVLCSHCLCLRLLQWLRSAHWLCSCLTWQAEDLPAGSAAAGRVSRRGAAAAALPPAPAQPLSSAHR